MLLQDSKPAVYFDRVTYIYIHQVLHSLCRVRLDIYNGLTGPIAILDQVFYEYVEHVLVRITAGLCSMGAYETPGVDLLRNLTGLMASAAL